jgi:hypothetical protein
MLHHARDIPDPIEQVAQARGVLKFLADASDKDSLYGQILRNQFDRVMDMRDEVLFHDDLSDSSTAFLLRDVIDAAGRYGLQYLSDATFARSSLQHASKEVVDVLSRLCTDDVVAWHQYQDFIEGHGFRRSLLCHAGIPLHRSPDPQCIRRYRLTTSAKPIEEGIDPAAEGVVSFKTQAGATLSTDHRLSKAALLHLGDCWPQDIGFSDLLEGARRRLGTDSSRRHGGAKEEELLTDLLLRAVLGGHVGLHLAPPQLTTTVSERPQTSRLARIQVLAGPVVTNQHHRTTLLEDRIVRSFLPLVDGTRTIDDLVTDLQQALAAPESPGDGGGAGHQAVTRESVEHNLAQLARLALLVA